MNSSKYIMRFWHVQRLPLFSVINPAFYWHAMGNFGRICSSLSQSSHLCWFLFISKVVYDKSLRMMSWGWGAEVWIIRDLFSLSNRPLIQSVSMVSSCIYVWDQRTQLGQDWQFTGSWFNSESYFKRLLTWGSSTNIKSNKKYSHLIQGRGSRAHWDSDVKKQYHLEK